jgi:hypothetical protein
LWLDYGEISQGAGQYALDTYDGELKRRVGTECGTKLIMRLLKVVGVEKWENLKNQLVRVKHDEMQVIAIGNVLNEEWINFKEFFKGES